MTCLCLVLTGKMTVDGGTVVTGQTDGEYVGLDLKEQLYIGGVPDFSQIHTENGFSQGFIGDEPRPRQPRP